jgi:hypothetical protein
MFIYFVSLEVNNYSEIENESKLFDYFSKIDDLDSISGFFCQFYIGKIDNIKDLDILENFLQIKFEKLGDKIKRIRINNPEFLKYEYLDENYLEWIKQSNRENTMDEFGSLLEIQKILNSDNFKVKYLIIGNE